MERERKEEQGVVISNKMEKTVVVKVSTIRRHPLYDKELSQNKKYYAHDLLGCKKGDLVKMRQTRPLSKLKRWRVVEKLS